MADDDDKKPAEETPADECDTGKKKPCEKDKDKTKLKSDDEESTEMPDESEEKTYGQKAIAGTHTTINAALKGISSLIGGEGKLVEQPNARKGLNEVHATLKSCLTSLVGLHSECYPESSGIKPEGESGDDSDLAAFLAQSEFSQNGVRGVAVVMKSMSTEKNLTTSQRMSLKSMSDELHRITTQAKSWKPVETRKAETKPEDDPASKALLERLSKLTA